MRKFFSFLTLAVLLLVSSLSIYSTSDAKSDDIPRGQKIQEAKDYIENNVSELTQKLNDLRNEDNLSMEKIEETIETHYENNPAPSFMENDKNLSIKDVFPKKAKKAKENNGKVLNMNELTNEAKKGETPTDGNVITLNYNNGVANIFISETGDFYITEHKTVEPEDGTITTFDNNTDTKRTGASAYNALGTRMFSMWSEGAFSYDGDSVDVASKDGDWQRSFGGSTLYIEERGVGKGRNVVEGDYEYAEVYTRLYYEAGFGIKWAMITLNSSTVETYVGSTVAGSTYGGAQHVF
ncbi:hypothetical protein [Salibacterium aidingense]|uniref:hypothetical protein n=1 Tax=Salibacterium aidingense TaxID=384933 RepID=UPI00040993A7|nr:hypothetical protein [Salibacterium aidingense]